MNFNYTQRNTILLSITDAFSSTNNSTMMLRSIFKQTWQRGLFWRIKYATLWPAWSKYCHCNEWNLHVQSSASSWETCLFLTCMYLSPFPIANTMHNSDLFGPTQGETLFPTSELSKQFQFYGTCKSDPLVYIANFYPAPVGICVR